MPGLQARPKPKGCYEKVEEEMQDKLMEAVFAWEEELARVGAIAGEAQRLLLNSQLNLERTREKLGELGTITSSTW